MSSFASLKLPDLALGLRDLLGRRLVELRRSAAGRYHEPLLREQLRALEALPPILIGGAPLAQQLEAIDRRHDGLGAAIYFCTEAVLRWPDASHDERAAAERVRAAFIPSLASLQTSYATEAHLALEHQHALVERKADLDRLSLGAHHSLFKVAEHFVAAGLELDRLLSQRANVTRSDRTEAGKLRSRTVGLLGRLRDDLASEHERDQALPPDIEQRTLGYFELLAAMRARGEEGPPPEPAP